jgi:hypothetical protein
MDTHPHPYDQEFVAAANLRRYVPVAAGLALIGSMVSFTVTQTVAGNQMVLDYVKIPLGGAALLLCLTALVWLPRAWWDEGFLRHRGRIVGWTLLAAVTATWDLLRGFGVV